MTTSTTTAAISSHVIIYSVFLLILRAKIQITPETAKHYGDKFSRLLRHILCCHQRLFFERLIRLGAYGVILQIDVVQREGQRPQRLFPSFWCQFALPHRDAVPPHLGQPSLFLLVPLLVSPYLVHPKFTVSPWNLAAC